jgi:integrase
MTTTRPPSASIRPAQGVPQPPKFPADLGLDHPAAEKSAQRTERKRETVDDSRSLEAVGKRWISQLRREGKRSADEVARMLDRHVFSELGGRPIESIAKADGHRLYERLADAGHAPMGHSVARNLKALLSYAVERDLIPVNPLLRIKLPRLVSRERVLIAFHPEREPDPAELVAVWNAADQLPEPRGSFIKLLALTLTREDELAGMEWAELDDGLWRIPAARHKGKRGHDVPLPEQAVRLIEGLPRVTDHVFYTGRGRHIGDFSGIKGKLDRLSGVRGWRIHDLRRSGSSWIEEEFGREVMHACLGHSIGDRLAQTYARGSGYRRKRSALQAWADFVSGAARGNVVALPSRRGQDAA